MLTKPAWNARSVSVWVEAPELANIASTARVTSPACEGSESSSTYQPTIPAPPMPRSLRYFQWNSIACSPKAGFLAW